MSNKTILITGATAGIGKATAIKFAEASWNLILTGRRAERLEELKTSLLEKFNLSIKTLCFDVRNRTEVTNAIDSLDEKWQKIDVLLNNAGLALGKGPFQEGNIDDWDTMIDTNLKGLLYMTRKVAPFMIKNGSGHIINIGSLAGMEVYPGGNVYCATKHAVKAVSRAMRMDMVQHGIKVTSVNPGLAETEFSEVRFKGDKDKAKKVYNGFKPLYGDDVADIIYFAATRPPHVNMDEILVLCTAQADSRLVNKNQ